MKSRSLRAHYYPFLALITLFTCFISCRKTEIQKSNSASDIKTNRFLQLPLQCDPKLVKIAQALKNQDEKNHFIARLAEIHGIPQWNQTVRVKTKEKIAGISASGQRMSQNNIDNNVTSDEVLLIPLVLDSTKFVRSFLACKLSDTVSFQLYDGAKYSEYGYNRQDHAADANLVARQLMMMEKQIFNYDKFVIMDQNLSFYKKKPFSKGVLYYRLQDKNVSPSSQKSTYLSISDDYGSCEEEAWFYMDENGYVTQVTDWYDVGGPCGFAAIWVNDDTPGTYWWARNSGGYGEGGGGTQGGGDGDPEGHAHGFNSVNSQGYLYSKLEQLKNYILADKWTPIPCLYLSLFYSIGNYQPPQSVLNKLNTVTANYLALTSSPPYFGPAFVQNINDASGSTVNCDYFPVRITQLPAIGGVQMTPDQLLEYFRKNINLFVDNSLAEFEPYQTMVVDETTLWNSSNPLGALIHINMQPKDGSVILSDYNNTVPFSSHNYFTFTTVRTPLDDLHPVSGNRRFGIQSESGGEYTFYTTGVDRITLKPVEWVSDAMGILGLGTGFDKADDLWKSMQAKMISFINSNGGSAALYTPAQVIARPQYSDIIDFLQNYTMSLAQLKSKMGC